MKTLEGKVAIVTGGAGGIGGAISTVLVERGARVLAVDVNQAELDALAAKLGEAFVPINGDVSSDDVAKQVVAEAIRRFGRLDALVNNAHVSRQKPFTDLSDDDWDLSFKTGLWATRNFCRAAYPELVKVKGAVVNFGSGAGMTGQPTQAAYASAKEAIRGLTRVLASEWGKSGVRVNTVCPVALTPGVAHWKANFPEMYAAVEDKIPLGRFGDPEKDVAPVVAFLIGDDSQYMTGQTVMADGGASFLR